MRLVLLLAFGVLAAGCQSLHDSGTAHPQLRRLAVDGTQLSYLEQGTGSAVVFVHGSISDHRVWEPQREVVSQSRRFIAIDRRYFGREPWPEDGKNFSEAGDVADLAMLIRMLDIAPAHLVARSGGARVALALAAQHPDLVRSVLVNEPPLSAILDEAERTVIASERASSRDNARTLAALTGAGKTDEATAAYFDWVNNQAGGFNMLPSAAKRMHLENGRTIKLELQTSAPTTLFSCALLGTVKAPVVITYGTLTRLGFKVFAEAAHRCIPGSTLVPIDEARHGAPNQQPAVFNRLLVQFLDGRNPGK